MSLQVWLPLNGDLTNNGIANATISGSNIVYDTGLMGKAKTTGEVIIDKNYQGIVGSMAMWIYTSPNGDTTRIFGNDSSGTKNRKWTIHRYPTRNDLHSWGCCEDSNTTNPGSSGSFTITGALPDNKWTHIVYAHNATNGYIYVNGELRHTTSWNSTGKVYTFSDPVPLLSENGGNKICDFRLYNHCLSAKEVKELAKGLVLHYRLAGPGGANLVSSSLINTTSYKYGFATRTVQIESGKQYTLSVKGYISEAAKNDGTTLKIYAYKSDWRYCPLILSISDIKETIVKGTFTANQTTALNITSYSYLQQSTAGSQVTVEWYKLEEGSVATPWCPNSADVLYSAMGYNNNIEYDCSGYRRNGTQNGNFVWSADSPRYTTSYLKTSNSKPLINIPMVFALGASVPEITMACWWKSDSTISTDRKNLISLGANNFIRFGPNSSTTEWIYCTGTAATITIPNCMDMKWHHHVITFKGGVFSVYFDGELKGTQTTSLSAIACSSTTNYIGAYNSNSEIVPGAFSDARIYATALSAEDIAELYHSAVIVDNTGKNYAYEYFEA